MLFTVTIFCCTAENWGCKAKKCGGGAIVRPAPLQLTCKYSNSYQSTIQLHINRHKLYTQLATGWAWWFTITCTEFFLNTIHTWICETKFLRLWNILV